jgi:hypothetical protein
VHNGAVDNGPVEAQTVRSSAGSSRLVSFQLSFACPSSSGATRLRDKQR